LGAWGLGWEVRVDGLEITQFTYFQQVGGIDLKVIPVELTYGLERIAMFLQGKDNVYDLDWTGDVTYGNVHHRDEYEFSKFHFELADPEAEKKNFQFFEAESGRMLKEKLVMPAYDYLLKCSHTFNLLDARGALSVTERADYVRRVRSLARKAALLYLEINEKE
ncbi:MAG TPA: glycine--tRNA ligase subunit alpha, partial [bacterium]|nr:glycine--tRNA ligase subunit alpha [bacterium]